MKLLPKPLLLICIMLQVVDFGRTVQTRTDKILGHSSILHRPPLAIVRFLNVPCGATNSPLTGTCFSLNDCLRMQGNPIGACAVGFGICCVFKRTCGAAVGRNSTHFVNPGYPGEIVEYGGAKCTVILLQPTRKPVCQIRLDFLQFNIGEPTAGDCLDDKFSVTGGNQNPPVPKICGNNTGQHMYIDVQNNTAPLFLTVDTAGIAKRKWCIRADYIECNNPSKAPQSCLQYYTGTEGQISSFNYITSESSGTPGEYLNNMNYAICFRKERKHCSITYSGDSIESLSILNLNEETNSPSVGAGEAGLGKDECPMDYLRLGGDRYCGARLNPSASQPNPNFNAPVTDNTTGPFIAHFRSDSKDTAIGFNLKFKQNSCG